MKKNIPWQLIIAHLKEKIEETEEERFQEWLLSDENSRLYEELQALWKGIHKEVSVDTPDTSYYWRQMENRMNGTSRKKQKQVSLRKYHAIMAVASILLVISLVSPFLYKARNSNTKIVYAALSGKSRLTLPDSSIVWLNSGSTLEYTSDFWDGREVSLNGEALFDVVKEEKRPFVVSASGMKVKVYGTRFNVNAYAKEDNVMVTLFRGLVSVSADEEEKYLHPGEIALLNKKLRTLNIRSADLFFESFWANESVRFESKSIRYITRYLEKWYNVKIEVDKNVPDSQAYTFTVKDESLEVILRIMSRINPIAYTFDEDNHIKISHVEPTKRTKPMR